MVEKYQIYKCELCGNTVGMIFAGGGELVCCGQPMSVQEEKTADQGMEKHVPVVEESAGTMTIKVGSTEHPMTDDHYIQWIDTIADDAEARKYLKPGETPSKQFQKEDGIKKVRAYCNIHGLWKQEV